MQFVFQYEIDCLMDIHQVRVVNLNHEWSIYHISWKIVAQVGKQFRLSEYVIQFGRRWNVPVSLLGSLGMEPIRTQGSLKQSFLILASDMVAEVRRLVTIALVVCLVHIIKHLSEIAFSTYVNLSVVLILIAIFSAFERGISSIYTSTV